MKITVIVCTYNRCESLAGTLESLAASTLDNVIEWEVLVVDNNSTDQTRQVVEEFCQRHPGRFRYLFESHPGKSHALNAGIHGAKGEILAFTDDDVQVAPTWLERLTTCLTAGVYAGSAGRTLLARSYVPPSWLELEGPDSLGGALGGLFDLGETPQELSRAPFGANMAFRRDLFARYGGFRTDLGPQPTSKIRNEDTEFGNRLLAAGERLRYEPSALVFHPIPTERLKKDYFLTWYRDYGRAVIREIGRRPDICGIPRRYLTIPKIALTVMLNRAIRWLTTFNQKRRFVRKCWVWVNAGQIREIHQQWRDI